VADIVVRDPFDIDGGLAGMRRAMRRMFEDAPWTGTPAAWFEEPLPVDIAEVNGNLKVEASLPGFGKDEIDVELSDGVLTIKAHHEEEEEQKEANYYRRERRLGAVSRRIDLPGRVSDDAKVEDELKDGVLVLTVPIPIEAKAKRIAVKGS
jgi:HSP20 family protein